MELVSPGVEGAVEEGLGAVGVPRSVGGVVAAEGALGALEALAFQRPLVLVLSSP